MKGLNPLALIYTFISHNEGERPYVVTKGLEVQGFHLGRKDTEFGPSGSSDNVKVDDEPMQAYADNPTPETLEAMAAAIHRKMHFALLNSGMAVAGMRWPVTEEIYWYFLEILPPMDYHKSEGFRICEANGTDPLGNYIRSAYYWENGTYWHEYVADKK